MFKKNQGELRETGRKAIQAAERIFLFTQPEQMASVHPRLAFPARDGIYETSVFLPVADTCSPLRLSPARALMHGCICVLTIMCGAWWMEVEERNLQGARLIQKSACRDAEEWGDPVTHQSPLSLPFINT